MTGLAYHPGEDLAVTTGDDSTFRVWARTAAPRSRAASTGAAAPAPAAKGHWLCRSVGSYRGALLAARACPAGVVRVWCGIREAVVVCSHGDSALVNYTISRLSMGRPGVSTRVACACVRQTRR